MGREVRPARERQLGREARADELRAREDERRDARCEGGVGAFFDGGQGRERDEARAELCEGAEGEGDEAGFLGRGRAEDGEEDAREGLEPREGTRGGVVGERRERERRQGVVEGRVCWRAAGQR